MINTTELEVEPYLTRARQLDLQALGSLHDQYYPVVYRYVAYRLDEPEVCEDISGEVFLRLVEALRQRKDTIRDVRAWLLGTASHLVMDHLRHKYRHPNVSIEDHDNLPIDASPEGIAEQTMHKDQLRNALTMLTSDQQHVLALRFSQEFSLEETALAMGKTIGAVKVLQFRALETLRRLLEERWKQ